MPQDQVPDLNQDLDPDQDLCQVPDQDLDLDQDQCLDQEQDQNQEIVPDLDIGTALFRIRFIEHSNTKTKT
jgi:hypothetical protein